ncbi:hypothetical protein ACKI2C_51200, partial [Streptomyces brasiliscabiei]
GLIKPFRLRLKAAVTNSKNAIDNLIVQKPSPEQVCGYLNKHHHISPYHNAIYRYLQQEAAADNNRLLILAAMPANHLLIQIAT